MSSKRIFVNDNIHNRSAQRGVVRYFRNIVNGITEFFGSDTIVFSPEVRAYGKAKHIVAPTFRGSRYFNFPLASLLAYLGRASIIYSSYYGNIWTSATQIFTVYDMNYELFPEYFAAVPHSVNFIKRKRRCLERADALIAISESTARDIVTCYPHIDPSKVSVVYLGVDSFFLKGVETQSSTSGRPYFVYIGRRALYKNFLRLLVAFGKSGLAKKFDLRVISPVGSNFNSQECEIISKYRMAEHVHLMNSISDEELRESYAGAVALVYPSEYEGFGLPILEAMACGTIVATSNTSSMPEVGGKVAFYFDPTNTESIIACLQRVAELPAEQRKQRINRGIERAQRFSWSRCQSQTIEVFRSFL
jgi:glycosyltransferase involved in cell wall biosynthesis